MSNILEHKFECPICNDESVFSMDIRRHTFFAHNCESCGCSLTVSNSETDKYKFKLLFCNKSFDNLRIYYRNFNDQTIIYKTIQKVSYHDDPNDEQIFKTTGLQIHLFQCNSKQQLETLLILQ